jgi:sporulation protein YabP
MTMEERKSSAKLPHCLTLDNRKNLTMSGVSEVDSFDDRSIIAYTDVGELTIKGENLNIKKLNLELGELEVTGKVASLVYADNKLGSNAGFFSRLFK